MLCVSFRLLKLHCSYFISSEQESRDLNVSNFQTGLEIKDLRPLATPKDKWFVLQGSQIPRSPSNLYISFSLMGFHVFCCSECDFRLLILPPPLLPCSVRAGAGPRAPRLTRKALSSLDHIPSKVNFSRGKIVILTLRSRLTVGGTNLHFLGTERQEVLYWFKCIIKQKATSLVKMKGSLNG